MKYQRNTDIIFIHNGVKYHGKLMTFWADMEHCHIICDECPDKDFLSKAPLSCIVETIAIKEVYVVTDIIEGDVRNIKSFISEDAARSYANTILSEVARNSNKDTTIEVLKDGSILWMDAEIGEWGNIFINKTPVLYDCDNNGNERSIKK